MFYRTILVLLPRLDEDFFRKSTSWTRVWLCDFAGVTSKMVPRRRASTSFTHFLPHFQPWYNCARHKW